MNRTRKIQSIEERLDELRALGVISVGEFSKRSIASCYDGVAAFSVSSRGYLNFGFWKDDTNSYGEAQENLMKELLRSLNIGKGKVLDVACGLGATTRYLLNYWSASCITGINFTLAQVKACRQSVPECDFHLMDATSLGYRNESFSSIVCVEGAQHFRTRADFLSEALRTLVPGGRIALSDILLFKCATLNDPMYPPENYLASPKEYIELMKSIGYSDVRIHDITVAGWERYARFFLCDQHEKWLAGGITFESLQRRLHFLYSGWAKFSYNLIVTAKK